MGFSRQECYNLGDHKELDMTEHAHTQPLFIDDILRPFCLHPLEKTSQTSFWFTMVSVVPIKHIDAACSLAEKQCPGVPGRNTPTAQDTMVGTTSHDTADHFLLLDIFFC